MRLGYMLISATILLSGCGSRQVDGGDGQAGAPDWSPCVVKDEVMTCAEVCAADGMECVPGGCPADPEFCDPEPCDMATRVMALGDEICTDPSVGGYFADPCDVPIEWLFSNTARCCCEG